MDCRDIDALLSAERDGVLTPAQHASLEEHLATCPACRQSRAVLGEVSAAMRTDAAGVAVPDIDEEWRIVRARMGDQTTKAKNRKTLAPVLWFGAPLAAAAAVVIAFFANQPAPVANDATPAADVASAEFVEAGDADASTMVYVDKDSGWLVVWATDAKGEASG